MLFPVTLDTVNATRALICDAIDARKEKEKTLPQRSLDSKLSFLNTFRNRVLRADAFALGFLGTHPVAFDAIFMSHRRSNAMFNIYAMPKCLEVARCLNGGALDSQNGGDHMTIAGVVLAINDGITLESKIAHSVNMYAQYLGRVNYSSGATQSSSTLRALEAFGIVKQAGKLGNCQYWDVADANSFARMLDASNGKRADSVSADTDAAATAESGASDTATGRKASRKAGKGRKAGKSADAAPDAASVPAVPAGWQSVDTASDAAPAVTIDEENPDAGEIVDPFNRRDAMPEAVTAF
jgi:hypothetical protein